IRIIERGVKGMLPKTKLGKAMVKKLFVYEGTNHPHGAQKPTPITF
ncbi:MAG: uL13 family ribosomal protein, partial [Saprospiraceae bacterium]